LTEYRGLTVKDIAALRRTLREAGSEYKIYKNTLVRFAAHDLGLSELDSLLTGPTAIAFVDGDAASVAKALREYAKTNPKLTVKGGVLGNRIMSVADASALADLPPREVVLARLAGALASPMQTFAGLLAAVPRNFAYGLKALLEKRGGAPSSESADATDASAPVDGETSTSTDAPSAPPSGSAEGTVVADAAPVAAPEPEPVVAEPEPVAAEPEPEPGAAAEPEPVAASEPEPVAASEPEPVAAAEPEPVAAAEPAATSVVEAEPVVEPEPEAAVVAESVAEVVPEPPLPETAPDADEPAAALVADHNVSDPGITLAAEATEPPELEDATEAAASPALVDEPVEVEPLAAHGIPALVEPEILSVAPEPEVALESDATPIDPPTTPADSPSAD
jgi:large subunit ribosomal protein L10